MAKGKRKQKRNKKNQTSEFKQHGIEGDETRNSISTPKEEKNEKKTSKRTKKVTYFIILFLAICIGTLTTFLNYILTENSPGKFTSKDMVQNEKIVKNLYYNGLKNDINHTFSFDKLSFEDTCYDIETVYNQGLVYLDYDVERLTVEDAFLILKIKNNKFCFYDTFNHTRYQEVIVDSSNSFDLQLYSNIKPNLKILAIMWGIDFLISFGILLGCTRLKKLV